MLEGHNRLRSQFCPYSNHKGQVLLTYDTALAPDCSGRRSLEEIRAIVDSIDLSAFKGGLRPRVEYEPAKVYRMGWTRAHFLTRYHPDRKFIGVREYCGLPMFPERVLRTGLYLSLVALFLHRGSPDHLLFAEKEQSRRAKFVGWFVDAACKADELFGDGALAEYCEFRKSFMSWALANLPADPASKRGVHGERVRRTQAP